MKNLNDITTIAQSIQEISDTIRLLSFKIEDAEDDDVKKLLIDSRLSELEWLQKYTIALTEQIVADQEKEEEPQEENSDSAFMPGELTVPVGEAEKQPPFRGEDPQPAAEDAVR